MGNFLASNSIVQTILNLSDFDLILLLLLALVLGTVGIALIQGIAAVFKRH